MNNNVMNSKTTNNTSETNIDNLSDALLDKVLPKKDYKNDLINVLDDLRLFKIIQLTIID